MEPFIESMNNFEAYVMRYIHRKYLKQHKVDYQEYKKKVLGLKRPRIINQTELLKTELNDIKQADRIYFKHTKNLNATQAKDLYMETEYGYPDRFRCKFIINKKNNLIRCRRRIINGDAYKYDCCLSHNKQHNIYLDRYLEMCKDLK